MNRAWTLRCGAALAALGVAMGAFAAHGLRGRLEAPRLEAFATGVDYHLLHAVGLLVVAALWERGREPWLRATSGLLGAGIVLFSGSLYALALTGWSAFGMVTPFGGTAFILGWLALALGVGRPGSSG